MFNKLRGLSAILILLITFSSQAAIVINEVDYDQAGGDTAEFIELYNNGAAAVDITGYTLELFNGSAAQSVYQTVNLPAQMLAADSYFVICATIANVPNCDLDAGNDNLVQNGGPDGMALRDSTTTVIDALSYEGVSTAPYSEGTSAPTDNAGSANMGISRAPNGIDSDDNGADFIFKSITPGAANTLPPVSFSINDISQVETDAGTNNFIFTVTISAAADATVDWATSDGTATTADSDYVAVAATTLTFTSGGATTQMVTVVVNGDTAIELNETFNVDLTNATGGATISDNQGVGTITNDDAASFSINDVAIVEGNAGTTTLDFTVTIDATADATVDWATSDGTATTADSDYVAVAATTLTFTNGGATTQTVSVTINGDVAIEANETFNVDLTNAVGATISDALAVGTITNDDTVQAELTAVKSVSGDLNPGGMITYTIVISNAGPNVQNDNPGDEMTDVLPASMTFISGSATNGTVTNAGNTVSWNGLIAAAGSETVTIVAQINASAAGSIDNQAIVSFDSTGDNINDSSAQSNPPIGTGPTSFFIAVMVPSLTTYSLMSLFLLLLVFSYRKLKH